MGLTVSIPIGRNQFSMFPWRPQTFLKRIFPANKVNMHAISGTQAFTSPPYREAHAGQPDGLPKKKPAWR